MDDLEKALEQALASAKLWENSANGFAARIVELNTKITILQAKLNSIGYIVSDKNSC